MADEANIKTHRYYQKDQHIKLPKSAMTKALILAAGINALDNANVERLFLAGNAGFYADAYPERLWTDVARTTPLTAPGTKAASWMLNTAAGVIYATQASDPSRPIYGRHPSSGIRNLANGSADVGTAAVWPATFVQNGITHTKIASGIGTDGLPYTDYTIVGTAAGSAFFDFYAFANARVASATGQTFTTSFFAQVTAGSIPPAGCGAVAGVVGETAPSTVVENSTGAITAPSTETLITQTFTFVNVLTNQARCGAYIRTASGSVVNYTMRIKGLQFEQAAARSAFQTNLSRYDITEAPFAYCHYLQFDGVDDSMATPAINFSGTDEVTVCAGVQKLSDAARGVIASLGNETDGTFSIEAPAGASATYQFVSRGTGTAFAFASGYTAPQSAVLTGQGNISADQALLRRNGVQIAAPATDQGAGNYANDLFHIGRRGSLTLPFNGRIYALAPIGRLLSAAELRQLEVWAANKTGVTI